MKLIGKKLLFDMETGQEVKVILYGKYPTHYKDTNFVKVFNAFLEDMITDNEIAGKSIRLLLYMITKMQYNSLIIQINRKEAIKELKITEATYYNYINTLIKKGIIKKLSNNIFKLQPASIIKGQLQMIPDEEVTLPI